MSPGAQCLPRVELDPKRRTLTVNGIDFSFEYLAWLEEAPRTWQGPFWLRRGDDTLEISLGDPRQPDPTIANVLPMRRDRQTEIAR